MHKTPPNNTHSNKPVTGVLITNLGTPDAPTRAALKRYLKEFLWDPRLVEISRPVWWVILHAFILMTRPAKSAKAYQQVWTDEGSPLLCISRLQQKAIQADLEKHVNSPIKVAMGMRYGRYSIKNALDELREANVQHLVVLPLYPQYSAATTASTFDAIAQTFKHWRYIPELHFISHYYDNEGYIQAMADSIQQHWSKQGRSEKLFFSFHGLPASTLAAGDPYFYHCKTTAALIASQLNLKEDQWLMAFQSRFGREAWLKPYADETLVQLGETGLQSLDVVCPGFSADCLETLEEMAIENKKVFEKAGGGSYHYIPALNDAPLHIEALSALILDKIPKATEI